MPANDKTYKPLLTLTVRAAGDLPARRFVTFGGALCGDENKALGVTEVSFSEGENASVVAVGTAIVECGASVETGDRVTSDEEGKAKPVAAEEEVNGIAVKGSAAAGFVTVLLINS